MAARPRGHRPARTLYRVRATRVHARPRGRGASARVWVHARGHPRPRGCITASAGKRGRARTSGRKGRPDGYFHPKTSFMTSLLSMPATTNTGQFGSLFHMVFFFSFHYRSLPPSSWMGMEFGGVKGASARAKGASKWEIHKPLTKPWCTWTTRYLFLC
jgi:hypothetical protein